MKRQLVMSSFICGLVVLAISFSLDLLFERLLPSSPLLQDAVADILTGVAAGIAYYLYRIYRRQRRAWFESYLTVNGEIRNTLQVLTLMPDEEFMRALRPTIDQIDSTLRRNAPYRTV
jgi:hypothetical protein